MRLVLSGGGTGGHIFPAIALANKCLDEDGEVFYLGGEKSLEEKITGKEGISFYSLPVKPLPRKINFELFSSGFSNFKAVLKARKILKEIEPDIVVGTGGYVSGATILAARLLNIKTLIHEQNSVPGLTNKISAKFVDKIAISYEQTERYFNKKDKVILTGNPVRKEILTTCSKDAREKFSFPKNNDVLLVMGGSQGAASINELMLEIYDDLIEVDNLNIIHITGEKDYKNIKRKVDTYDLLDGKIIISSFMDDIENALAVANLVISRAGAVSIAEITALGLPSILIPYPYATNNHQEKNARVLEESGAAIIYKDDEFNSKLIFNKIKELLSDRNKLDKMSCASSMIGKPEALDNIYGLACDLVYHGSTLDDKE
ncbi:undecaprenyldiphospho-muramoylpentapeptide beta-N-acetylglucosaminyltransferase [Halanaerobiaceae bacterium Z-7014]|uniref:UDP-N-acetylglucosamine--N-acetylmuramyl-(pentapeptide) pyrophosphoryl-undecaprenol N-acetylglucosamine transferase n=1 Tax=Halonatronomonas betaini TaxID=2778430 RepID=A0A931FB63_9FIRM|nr:undecaprenyldiphospho-muramoylpentapeptide beta-N-acetylglucosaminyltransferase [Halonatronomonas betaini]MBF8437637.1 undecaprenyldiphospho-muramoylpentapeptide beta-N-acetylglucosaminyltransferase [Halonatronomonas betaini]